MWIVRLALSRPYTFVVMSLLIAVMGVLSIMTMSVDIFPKINIPVVTSIWSYSGLSPTEMQDRITTIVERALTTTVNNIEHMESQSIRGNSVIKMFFQPGTDVNGSVAQVTALSQTLIKPLPPGITPPLILQYNAADVPVIMLSLGSDQLSETEISDLGTNFIRTQLVAVQGAAVPLPYGGKTRVVQRRHRLRRALLAWPVAAGRRQRHAAAEPDHRARHRQDGADRVRRGDRQQSRGVGRSERHPDQVRERDSGERARRRVRPRRVSAADEPGAA